MIGMFESVAGRLSFTSMIKGVKTNYDGTELLNHHLSVQAKALNSLDFEKTIVLCCYGINYSNVCAAFISDTIAHRYHSDEQKKVYFITPLTG